jgi:predicted tellurium resistance membrane protein TerC
MFGLAWLLPLLTLTVMEIVLGIDNIIFITILVGRLPKLQQPAARQMGLGVALGTRLLLLLTLTWILSLDAPLFHLTDLGIPRDWIEFKNPTLSPDQAEKMKPEEKEEWDRSLLTPHQLQRKTDQFNGISCRDLILIVGGLFLIGKSTWEIHDKLEGEDDQAERVRPAGQFAWVLVQIALLDIVFSLDSVITAVGMARDQVGVMVAAMVIAVGVMLIAAGTISRFVEKHPTLKMLALAFLILIGVMLVAEGVEKHIERGYIYFAMAFSVVVEMLNIRLRKVSAPVKLHGQKTPPEAATAPPTTTT